MKSFSTTHAFTLLLGSFSAISPLSAGSSSAQPNPERSALCSSCPAGKCLCTTDGAVCGCEPEGHNYFGHAPISVMGDHVHSKGGLMASYRYMFMSMQQNYDGDSKISDTEARAGYMMAATDMDMQMHMLSVMYSPTNELTLMLMTDYKDNSMSMVNAMGVKSSMKSSGWADTTLAAYYSLYRQSHSSAHLGLGLSMPTGSIDEKMLSQVNQPYPMQLGSGTWDLKPSITWLGQTHLWSYGAQASAVIHLAENDNNYTLGDSAELTTWLSRQMGEGAAVSIRLTGRGWDNIDGHDSKMPTIPMGPMAGRPMSATADPSCRGGSRIDLALGLNLWHTQRGSRFAVEAGTALYQNLDGPQLGSEWFLTTGLQLSW